MTIVTYNRSEHEISVSGHAGAGPYGRDIVCAAASMLSYMLEDYAENTEEANGSVYRSGPEAAFKVKLDPEYLRAEHDCEVVLDLMARGYQMLADEYPDFINYEEVKGWQKKRKRKQWKQLNPLRKLI